MDVDAGAETALSEGMMRTVEVGGTTVLLARVGGRCHAVGATCPHAGGPLAEGVLHGSTVVCPWHKAAFRLDTGRCVAPPAVDDVAHHPVRIENGRLLVGPAAPIPMVVRDADARTMVIIGSGAAGTAAAQALREEGFGGRVVMVGREDRLPYDRTILSKYDLSGLEGGEKTPLHDAAFFERQDIERQVGEVVAVDPAARHVRFADGRELGYDAAVLASGGEPRRLEVPGADLPGVFVLRTAADVAAILQAVASARHVVVAGAGFIGMEAAASLRERGLLVTVVAPQPVPFEKQLGPVVGGVFRAVHERAGIAFRLEDEVVGVEGDTRVQFVKLRSGATLAADIVVVGLGVRPATGMLRGVALRRDGGVDTDAGLRVADGLYAAGDIAGFPLRGDGPATRVEHWRVAQQHGRVAALNMLGRGTTFDAVPYFWTIHFKKRLDYVGHAEQWDEVVIDGDLDEPSFTACYVKNGTVAAVAGWGRDQAMARAIGLMTDRKDWPVAALRTALHGSPGVAGAGGIG